MPFFAPVPVGHGVTLLGIEMRVTPLFGGHSRWDRVEQFLVLDEDSRIVYADGMAQLHAEATFEQIRFKDESYRLSQGQAPLRGRVVSCVALSDHGNSVYFRTVLRIAPDVAPARF